MNYVQYQEQANQNWEGEPGPRDDIAPVLERLEGRTAQMNEDTEAEVRGILDDKAETLDTIRDLLGDGEMNEDVKAEIKGLLQSDKEDTDMIMDLLGL